MCQRFNQAKSTKNTAAFSKALIEYARGCEDGRKHKKWTEEDLEQFVEEYDRIPKQWKEMSKKFPGRSAVDFCVQINL